MVTRPYFSPQDGSIGVLEKDSPPFKWNPGFSHSQKLKNVRRLHLAICHEDPTRHPLEVSSKSSESLGISLSAFNLGARDRKGLFNSVESVFQASKVFEGNAGPFPDLYSQNPAIVRSEIKKYKEKKLVGFKYGSEEWGLEPTRAFYDWVYCRALHRNSEYVEKIKEYNCFTDIEFNPVKSLNCQAYAIALYLSLERNGVLEKALSCRESFLKFHPHDVVEHAKSNTAKSKKPKMLTETPNVDRVAQTSFDNLYE